MKTIFLAVYRFYSRLVSTLGADVRFDGPVIFQGRASVRTRRGMIEVESGVTINSCRWSNPLNVTGATSLFAGPGAVLRLRKGCGISSCQIIAHSAVEIGEEALVGAGSLICDSDMHEIPLGCDREIETAPIMIGRKAFIGARSIILKGVTIGEGSVIGAGSVVVSDIPPHVVAAGNPARVIKNL
ncbi:hypothetical protein N9115_01035 [bacterium]|nr:hypothetical protein [bacterium]